MTVRNDGAWEYEGETDVHWDGQLNASDLEASNPSGRAGEFMVTCGHGHEWDGNRPSRRHDLEVRWIVDPAEEVPVGIIRDDEHGEGVIEFPDRSVLSFVLAQHIVELHNRTFGVEPDDEGPYILNPGRIIVRDGCEVARIAHPSYPQLPHVLSAFAQKIVRALNHARKA